MPLVVQVLVLLIGIAQGLPQDFLGVKLAGGLVLGRGRLGGLLGLLGGILELAGAVIGVTVVLVVDVLGVVLPVLAVGLAVVLLLIGLVLVDVALLGVGLVAVLVGLRLLGRQGELLRPVPGGLPPGRLLRGRR